jgi:peptidoglycan/LPS O-acetylase OafA/YrhL
MVCSKINKEIQCLRGLSILGVIAFHSKDALTPNGYLGVDIFFLISGYLIIPRAIEAVRTKSLKKFYERRFRRLAPATIFMLLTMLPAMLILGSWQSHSQFAFQGILTLFLLGNVGAILITGDYFSPNGFMPLVHTWSLSLEEQFYSLLPMVLKARKFLLVILSAASLLLFVSKSVLNLQDEPWLFYLIFARIWEFHLGYLIYVRKSSTNLTWTNGIFPFLLLMVYIFLPVAGPNIIGTLLVLILASMYILQGSREYKIIDILGLIGNRAYSLYLFHMPILYLAKYSPLIYSQDRMVHTAIGLVITIAIAELCYRKFEYSFMIRRIHEES